MISEVRLKKDNPKPGLVFFSDLKNGEGTIGLSGNLRLRISDADYVHFLVGGEITGAGNRDSWPLNFRTDQPIRKFKLIAEEI